MFRRKDDAPPQSQSTSAVAERITSVLGNGTSYTGKLSGRGGVRIEGAYEGEIALNGMLVVGTTGRVTCEHVRATTVIVTSSPL